MIMNVKGEVTAQSSDEIAGLTTFNYFADEAVRLGRAKSRTQLQNAFYSVTPSFFRYFGKNAIIMQGQGFDDRDIMIKAARQWNGALPKSSADVNGFMQVLTQPLQSPSFMTWLRFTGEGAMNAGSEIVSTVKSSLSYMPYIAVGAAFIGLYLYMSKKS